MKKKILILILMFLLGYIATVMYANGQVVRPNSKERILIFDGSDESAEDIAVLLTDNNFFDEVEYDHKLLTLELRIDTLSIGLYPVGTKFSFDGYNKLIIEKPRIK